MSGKDIEKIFLKENFLQKNRNRDRQVFKKSLRIIGRNDLAVKLVRGKSEWYSYSYILESIPYDVRSNGEFLFTISCKEFFEGNFNFIEDNYIR